VIDQTEFNLLSDNDKWREYRDSSERLHTVRDRLAEVEQERDNLAGLVRMLLAYPQSLDARKRAGDYLERRKLFGKVLRVDEIGGDMSIDFLLLVELCGGFRLLEEQHSWDLSIGETSRLLEIFYPSLMGKFPETIAEWDEIFEKAYAHTWGEDHNETKKAEFNKKAEFKTLVGALLNSLVARGFNFGRYYNSVFEEYT
jgi:hypothetical protein